VRYNWHRRNLHAMPRPADVNRIRDLARRGAVRFTLHAHQEMVEEDISVDEVLEALSLCDIVEDYPEHRRGACCLVTGQTAAGRPLHIVCTSGHPVLVVITVYEPKPPKWVTPYQRGDG